MALLPLAINSVLLTKIFCTACMYLDLQHAKKVLTEVAASAVANKTIEALMQQNVLTPIVRYAGAGYNIIKGNPEGDFTRGGIDPGIKATREIFAFTNTKNRKVYYQRRQVSIPDQVSFLTRVSCATQHSEQAFSGSKSYSKELERSVSVSGALKVKYLIAILL